jgi:ribosomal protein L35
MGTQRGFKARFKAKQQSKVDRKDAQRRFFGADRMQHS